MPQQPWDNQAGSTWITWFLESTAEVDAVYELALKLGIPAPWPPTDTPWGVHECHIRHPDGHTFASVQTSKGSERYSLRNARDGSIFVARQAGRKHATSATPVSSNPTIT